MKKILLLVTGMSPQIVTETLYGLAVKPKNGIAWVPNEIHVVSTTGGLTQIRASLFNDGYFAKLLHDYQLPAIHFDESCLHSICDANNQALPDLKTPNDNELAANTICEQVRQFTADANTALHVSIAGGRKTMGFYAGYALSLYGRIQDRMSHVLVSSEFESSREFFYPAPKPKTTFVSQNGKTERLDAYDAQVWLADIPFVRLRSSLNKHALIDKAPFSDVVAAINESHQSLYLKINTAEGKTLWVNDQPVILAPREFAFYAACMADCIGDNNGILRPTQNVYSDDSALFHQFYTGEQVMFDGHFFDERKAELKKVLTETLSLQMAERLLPQQEKDNAGKSKRNTPYRIIVDSSHITFIDKE